MPRLGPISRRELIRRLRQLGFGPPVAGTRHEYKEGRGRRVRIPNPHRGSIGADLLPEILRQTGISRDEWEAL
jgi:predicted RNA binding protein YcfA (HicA-like mRNA interferase family)